MTRPRGGLTGLVLAVAGLCAPAGAGVIVVDASGGGDFTSLQVAVDAANPGDTLLVKSTMPDRFDFPIVVGKPLRIVADVPEGTYVTLLAPLSFGTGHDLEITGLAAGQQVVLRGFEATSVRVVGNAGSVWIERCRFIGDEVTSGGFGQCEPYLPGVNGETGLFVASSASVTVVRSECVGGKGSFGQTTGGPSFTLSTAGGAGVSASQSAVALYECDLRGGWGGDGVEVCGLSGPGGSGVAASASQILLSGCTVTGGDDSFSFPNELPGPGVSGDAASTIEVLDSSVVGGDGGVDYATAPGTLFQYSDVARSFALPSPLREGQPGTLAMSGAQGDFVAFFFSFQSGSLPMPARNGWFVLSTSFLAGPFLVGAITDPGGAWNLPMTGPTLPAGVDGQTFLLQAYFQYVGGVTLGSGTAFTVLDASF